MDEENKLIMARNIKKYMDMKGVTNQQICDDLGFKYTTFMDWIKGVTYPRIGKIEAMANYFGIRKTDLIEEKPPEEQQKKPDADEGLSDNMRELMDFVRTVPEDKAAMILSVIRTIVESGK